MILQGLLCKLSHSNSFIHSQHVRYKIDHRWSKICKFISALYFTGGWGGGWTDAHLRGIFSSLMAATVSFTSCLVKKSPSRSGCKLNYILVRHKIRSGNDLFVQKIFLPSYVLFLTRQSIRNSVTTTRYITHVHACMFVYALLPTTTWTKNPSCNMYMSI